ncbi:MAG: DUF2029 domain-containing protein [bacterium]|nr:DUF2029 domain-containing protein [bacterium]
MASRPADSSGRPRTVRLLWSLLVVAIAVVLVVRATARKPHRGVIIDHVEFGRRLLAGDDVYGPWKSDPDAPIRPLHAPYPPSYGLLTLPFALVNETFGLRTARFAWACLQVLAIGAMAFVMRRLAVSRAPPDHSRWLSLARGRWPELWLIAFVLGARFILRDTHGGGGNLINIAMCLLAFYACERDRAGIAGLLLGFSLATKPTQLWLLPLLLVLGRHRAFWWTILAGLGCVLVTVLLQRGDHSPWLRWIEGSWALGTQRDPWADPHLEFPPFEWMNQSLRFAVARWFGEVPPEFAAKVAWGVSPGLGLDAATVGWIARVLSLGLLTTLLVAARRLRRSRGARLWLFATALVLSVLLSPLSWKAHHVALLPVLVLLLQLAMFERQRLPLTLLIGWAVTTAFPGGDVIGDDGAEWFNSIYLVTAWDLVILLLALGYAVRAARMDDSAEDSAAPQHDEPALGAH